MTMPAIYDPPTPLQIGYTDPDGNYWNLSDQSLANGYICTGIAGIEGVPVMAQLIPLLDGSARSDLFLAQPGSIAIGILIVRPASDAENDYYALLDRITSAFYNRRNTRPVPGVLSIQRPDGTIRSINTLTTSGLNTPEVAVSNGTIYTFTLQTPDPFWSDSLTNQLSFIGSGSAPGILPLLPISLAQSTIFGANQMTNNGTADAWPTWNLTGPGGPTIQNVTTGRTFALSTNIPSGQVVQIVTKPGSQQCYNLTTQTNIWDQLSFSSPRDLWPLIPGINNVSITMGSSTAASKIVVSWQNRWLRA
jgi:Phage tail protein